MTIHIRYRQETQENQLNIKYNIIPHKFGFKKIIIPYANDISDEIPNIEIVKVKRIIEAITRAVKG